VSKKRSKGDALADEREGESERAVYIGSINYLHVDALVSRDLIVYNKPSYFRQSGN
jgi:hypothetical protein